MKRGKESPSSPVDGPEEDQHDNSVQRKSKQINRDADRVQTEKQSDGLKKNDPLAQVQPDDSDLVESSKEDFELAIDIGRSSTGWCFLSIHVRN